MLPIVKLCCLVTCAISHYFFLTPPNPAPTSKDKVFRGQLFEIAVRKLAYAAKMVGILALAIEFLVVAAVAFPHKHPVTYLILPTLCGRTPDPLSLLSISPSFLIGSALVLSGTWIRVWCYRTLGTLFTYEVTVRPSHQLIVTGPYAYVRHPSYTGGFTGIIGFIVLHFSSGSWNRECHIMSTPGGWMVWVYFGVSLFGCISAAKRGKIEDELLRDRFGSGWDRYRADVPWMFLPGVV